MKHPVQPLEKDISGRLRFKENKIVNYLLKNGGIDLNHIASLNFSGEDRIQFAQLIGYSLSGYGELGYVDDISYCTAENMGESGKNEMESKIDFLEGLVNDMKKDLAKPMARLFSIHPDDLK